MRIITWAAALLGLWLGVKFILPLAAPFLVAYLTALALEWAVRLLMRWGLRRSVASAAVTVSAVGLFVWGLTSLTLRGVSAATEYVKELPALVGQLALRLRSVDFWCGELASSAPDGTEELVTNVIASVTDSLYSIPEKASGKLLALLGRLTQSAPHILLFAVTVGIGTYLFSAALPRVNAFLLSLLPEKLRRRLDIISEGVRNSFGGFIRSQLIMIGVTFFELLLGFLLLKIPGAVTAAVLTAIIDALPVFGTGAVLIPWGLICLLTGKVSRGAWLLALWGLIAIVQNCMQAKLVGDQIGLDPISSLISIYVGWCLWGVWGMLLCPILVVTLRQLQDAGAL